MSSYFDYRNLVSLKEYLSICLSISYILYLLKCDKNWLERTRKGSFDRTLRARTNNQLTRQDKTKQIRAEENRAWDEMAKQHTGKESGAKENIAEQVSSRPRNQTETAI